MFAAIFIPDFPAEAIVRVEPELRERAVAVVEGIPPLLHIVACNQRAREAGVAAGMAPLEAEGHLAGHVSAGGWGALQIRRRSPVQEMAAHAALLDCACAFSPRVEDNTTAPDIVVLDLQGLDRLFGPPVKIARELARRISEFGLATRVAVAANIETAVYAARGFAGVSLIPPGQEAERLGELPVATLWAGSGVSAGRTVADERAAEMLDTLARWGVRTFRALAALPESAVRQRLGEAGVQWQRLARGEGSRPLVPAEPPLKFEEAVEPEYPVVLLEPLAFLLNRMLEQLCARLAARALAAGEISLQLESIWDLGFGISDLPDGSRRQENCRSLAIARDDKAIRNPKSEIPNPKFHDYVLRFPVPMADPKVLLKLLQLELQAKPPAAPVKKIFLAAEPISPRFTQGGLFLPAAPEPEKLEVTLARIRNIVFRFPFPVSRNSGQWSVVSGQQDRAEECTFTGNRKPEMGNSRVGVAELLDTHRPDAFRMRKFNTPVPRFPFSVSRKTHDAPSAGNPPRRATGNFFARTVLRRFRPPRPARVKLENGCPKTVSGSPFPVSRGRVSERAAGNGQRATGNVSVVWAAGPWQESGEWWSENPWAREVWDVAVDQAGALVLYRIFRDVMRDEWFVEASFD
jgi:protein ImuB